MSPDEFWNGDPAPEPLEVSMSTDALAALLHECPNLYEVGEETVPAACEGDYRLSAAWLAAHGVVVLPADHPLRTGEPSEAMTGAIADHLATMFAWGAESAVKPLLLDAARNIGRAALAVLRL